MKISIVGDGGRCVIRMAGRFDTHCRREFVEAVAQAVADAAGEIQVDLGGVEYIDSSGLGMLLMVRESAKSAGKTVSIANASGNVRQVLDIANFHKLFALT